MDKEVKQSEKKPVRAIAFYLPQYHPIAENDNWWGKGFTEWTNVAKAKPLYKNHKQPQVPADLGFYDLRLSEVREAQAKMAEEAGIEGFCYWHYWFGNGKKILERPLQEVLQSGKPNFPFCICWANETWTGIWHGAADRILIEQNYPGEGDFRAYFNDLLPYFRDERYIRVNGRPLFIVYSPQNLPEPAKFVALFKQFSKEAGLPSLFMVSLNRADSHLKWGFDAFASKPPGSYVGQLVKGSWWHKRIFYRKQALLQKLRKGLRVFNYKNFINAELAHKLHPAELPVLVPNWDNTPRSGRNGMVFENASPENFGIYLDGMMEKIKDRPSEERLLFIKAWNEWAEGNYLEPDHEYGRARLEICKNRLKPESDAAK